MKNNFLVKVPGLNPEEQKRFIFINLKDNIGRLKLAALAFLIIESLLLFIHLFQAATDTGITLNKPHIFLLVSIILFLAIFLAAISFIGKKAQIRRMTFPRLFIITGLMLILVWGVFLVIFGYNEGFLPSAYLLIIISIAIIPYLSFWEIAMTMIPSQAFLTYYVLFQNLFSDSLSREILLDSWSFCIIAVIVSGLFYSFRISGFKKDITLMEQNDRLRKHSEIDALTGILNRRKLDEDLDYEWQRSSRSQKPVSFLLIDLDHFKKYNDTYGHIEGDLCLKKAASLMGDALKRSTDKLYRYGGEEFAVLLPFTSLEAASLVAERLKKNIENARIVHERSDTGFLTISIGAASATGSHEVDSGQLCINADKALYAAKKSGRNKVVCFEG